MLSLLMPLVIFFDCYSQSVESSLLWEITGNGLEKPSFVFGTIHIICPEDLKLSPVIEKSVEKSELVVMELDMDDPRFMADMQRVSFNEDMKNISSDIMPEDLVLIDDFLEKNYHTEMTQVGILKPMALMSMVMLKSYNCPTIKSVEEFVLRFAAKNEIEIKGLETVDDQMGIFDEIPQEEQIAWIVEMIKDSTGTLENVIKFTNAYVMGDINAIYRLSQETYPGMMAYEEELLIRRNMNWIPKIREFIHEKPTFFAVGAGHLGGVKGILKLLEEKGYTVTAVSMD